MADNATSRQRDNATTLATPSSLSPDGSSFSVAWNNP
jgi:hypothetical protein